ncbi:hypothetical protein MBAV_002037 [Candidatus Magnetobacterium bavaricum]|uniref:Uncharacterized protein n=1 Tax=Candidatus Magnetobacterium bavaricum TaxID=29290 RepID=A0A0F3GUZ4_9BACT|nr:hypothetical protein MBAV_002037 [Candidatus Magnetobacterium bavaricum]
MALMYAYIYLPLMSTGYFCIFFIFHGKRKKGGLWPPTEPGVADPLTPFYHAFLRGYTEMTQVFSGMIFD